MNLTVLSELGVAVFLAEKSQVILFYSSSSNIMNGIAKLLYCKSVRKSKFGLNLKYLVKYPSTSG